MATGHRSTIGGGYDNMAERAEYSQATHTTQKRSIGKVTDNTRIHSIKKEPPGIHKVSTMLPPSKKRKIKVEHNNVVQQGDGGDHVKLENNKANTTHDDRDIPLKVEPQMINTKIPSQKIQTVKSENQVDQVLRGTPIALLMDRVIKTFFVDADVVVFDYVNRKGFVLVKDIMEELLLPEENVRKSLNELKNNRLIDSFCTNCEKNVECDCKESVKTELKAEAEANRQAAINNAKQQKRPIVMKFYYVNEEQFYDITKIRAELLRNAHYDTKTVEYRCPNCLKEFTDEDIPALSRNKSLHCTTYQVERVHKEELSKGQEIIRDKIARTVQPIENFLKRIDKEKLRSNHPMTSGRKKFIRQWENVAFALQWISVDDLNNKDQNDVIKDLSTMDEDEYVNVEDVYNQIVIDIQNAYQNFDLLKAKHDEIEDPTFIPIFLREGSITNQKITPYLKFIRREDRRRKNQVRNDTSQTSHDQNEELARLLHGANQQHKEMKRRELRMAGASHLYKR